MTLNIARFRRAELMLHACFGAEIADVVCQVISLCAEKTDARDDVPPTILLSDLQDRLGRVRNAALRVLGLAAGVFAEATGVSMLSVGFNLTDLPADVVIELDPAFAAIVDGSAVGVAGGDLPAGIAPDTTTRAWLDLVAVAAGTSSPTHFIYRQSEADDIGEELAAVTTILAALPSLNGEVIPFPIPEGLGTTRLPMVASIISALLTTDVALLIIGSDIVKIHARTPYTDEFLDSDDVSMPCSDSVATDLTSDGERLLAALPHVPFTVLVAMAPDTRLRPLQASVFAGAVGPFRHDRQAAIDALKAKAAWPLSDRVVGRIVRLYADPTLARPLLDGAMRIAGGRVTHADRSSQAPGITDRPTIDPAQCDRIAGNLAGSLIGHIASPALLKMKEAHDPFHQELVTLDQPDLIFGPGRGSALREAGAKLAFVGPPGCGKGMAAMAACAAMGCEALDVGAADFLASKLGSLEKNLRRIFDRARHHGNAALIFDEFDSIGSSRENAGSASYIISVTNALLVECDAHPLPIIFITNFPERIDKALLRRCDLVFNVKPIPPELEHRAFQLMLDGMQVPNDWVLSGTCTVSDFAQARRMARLTGDASPAAAAAAICRARDVRLGKTEGRGRIGFL